MTDLRAATVTELPPDFPGYIVTEEMIEDRIRSKGPRGAHPTYHMNEVAKFFFAMSASWLRLRLKSDGDHPETWFVNPDGTRMRFRRNDPGKAVSARVFWLSDIEPMVWSLVRFGGIEPDRLAHVLRVVEAQGVLYELLPSSPDPA
jgi:hypothetical protein